MKLPIFSGNKACAVLGSKKGFTLVELLISLAILMLVFTMVYQFFNFSGNMFRKTDKLASEQDQARLMILGLRRDLGLAMEIYVKNYDPRYDDPDDFPIKEGEVGIFVYNDRLARMNYPYNIDNIEYVYSITPVKNLKIELSAIETDPYIMHVVILSGDKELASTDIYFRNIADEKHQPEWKWFTIPEPPIDDSTIFPNAIIYQP